MMQLEVLAQLVYSVGKLVAAGKMLAGVHQLV
jgi:hypothetical protein